MALRTKDTIRTFGAASVMGLFPERPHVLALGEPTHDDGTLLRARDDLLRGLVEEGYRTIALESDCLRGMVVDEYVTWGHGRFDDVIERGFSHGFGSYEGNRELVRWMRDRNMGLPEERRVRFAGFDGPLEISGAESPRQVLCALYDHLAERLGEDLLPCTAERLDDLLGSDGPWADQQAMADPSRSVGRTPQARDLRWIADDLVALLDAQRPYLLEATSPAEVERAEVYGRTAVGLLRYHHWLADTSPARITRLLGVRDQMMAHHLTALAERGPVLVHAHNSHLQRERSSMRMWQGLTEWWSAGSLLASRWGRGYGFVPMALGTMRHHGVAEPVPGSVEGELYALGEERCVVDARGLARALGGKEVEQRESAWFGYAPLDPAHLADADGLVFVREAAPSGAADGGGTTKG
ncbi:erythromycin esterase family protein [Nocardiopsis sp. NPDC006938]|uniref:erythromycin esterase family protein n=1 Tax=Nocardiopsis sp. NPDC006938 TaxID=3364337 RepID=UPI00368BD8BA